MVQRLKETIYQKIRDDITYGILSPGERLIESKLGEEFGASRSPVREVLHQLVSEGLATFERNKGITVSRLSIKQVDEIYNLRIVLESFAAGLTAARTREKDIQYLLKLHGALQRTVKEGDLKNWLKNNAKFHDFFAERSGNDALNEILDIIKRRVYRYRYMIVLIPGHFGKYLTQHEALIVACREKDSVMAEKHMKQHLEKTRSVLIDYLSTFQMLSL